MPWNKGKSKYSAEQWDFVKKFYPRLGCKKCALALGFKSERIVESMARRIGVETEKSVKIANITESLEKEMGEFRVNPLNFQVIETPEVAYFLGFLWADGNLNRAKSGHIIRISIKSTDADNLREVCKKIGDFGECFAKRKVGNPRICFWTSNKHIFKILQEFDYCDKSFKNPNKILNAIPENLRHYWWRGYFDGDGSAVLTGHRGMYCAFISGETQDWNSAYNLFSNLKITKHKHFIVKNDKGKGSQIRLSNTEDIITFFNFIYPNFIYDNIGLIRKFNNLNQMKYLANQRKKRLNNGKFVENKIYE